jgi:hypothetical protein
MLPEPGVRRIMVTAQIVVEVIDPVALEKAALSGIDDAEFGVVEAGTTIAAVREAEAAEVRDDPVAAIAWLIDPERILDGVPGVATGSVTWEVAEASDDDLAADGFAADGFGADTFPGEAFAAGPGSLDRPLDRPGSLDPPGQRDGSP